MSSDKVENSAISFLCSLKKHFFHPSLLDDEDSSVAFFFLSFLFRNEKTFNLLKRKISLLILLFTRRISKRAIKIRSFKSGDMKRIIENLIIVISYFLYFIFFFRIKVAV